MAKSKKKNRAGNRPVIGLSELERRPGRRVRLPVLIVCEGETEVIYFTALRRYYRLRTVDIMVHDAEGGGPLEVVQRAIEMRAKQAKSAKRDTTIQPYEEVWCVFDRDAAKENPTFPDALHCAESDEIQLAISNPAFEYWYLLHFIETNRPFQDAYDLEPELCSADCIPNYQKTKDYFSMLCDRTKDAHDRAEKLYGSHPDRDSDLYPNPSTLVYQLVASIICMASWQQ